MIVFDIYSVTKIGVGIFYIYFLLEMEFTRFIDKNVIEDWRQ